MKWNILNQNSKKETNIIFSPKIWIEIPGILSNKGTKLTFIFGFVEPSNVVKVNSLLTMSTTEQITKKA